MKLYVKNFNLLDDEEKFFINEFNKGHKYNSVLKPIINALNNVDDDCFIIIDKRLGEIHNYCISVNKMVLLAELCVRNNIFDYELKRCYTNDDNITTIEIY